MEIKRDNLTPADRYARKNIRQFALKLNRKTDADMVDHLEQVDNIQGYIKSLIRADMDDSEYDR